MVVMKLETLSPNLVTIINKCLENSDLTKLIYYDCKTPWNPPTTPTEEYPEVQTPLTNPKSLFMTRIFPFRFGGTITNEQTQLRVYFLRTNIDNGIIENTKVYFDVICHNNLYLIKDQYDNTLLRPYKILTEISRQFDGKTIDSVGILRFDEVIHTPLNNSYSVLTFSAKMLSFGK